MEACPFVQLCRDFNVEIVIDGVCAHTTRDYVSANSNSRVISLDVSGCMNSLRFHVYVEFRFSLLPWM